MLGALRVITVQRGLDPREFGLVAFGGAGPLHANAMAELLGCYPVIVPPNPGVLSALGFLEAEFKNEFVQTFIRSTVGLPADEVWSRFRTLGERAADWLAEEGVAETDRTLGYTMDLRYEQQGFEVTVPVAAGALGSGDLSAVTEQFHILHERLYGVRFTVPVELVALRVTATGATTPVDEAAPATRGGENAVMERRPGYFGGRWIDTPHYDRKGIAPGLRVEGPAVIRQYDTTTVLLPDHYAEADRHGNLLIWPISKEKRS